MRVRNFSENKKKILVYFLAAVSSICIGCVSIRMWNIDLRVMPGMGGDGTLIVFLAKSIRQYGIKGTIVNRMVGAPDFSFLIDVPFLDTLFVLEILILNYFTGNFIIATYAVYILSFGLASVCMSFLLDHLKVKKGIIFIISILFSAAPFHFYRGMGHITLSNYFTIPLGIYLSLVILENNDSIVEKHGNKRKICIKSVSVLFLAAVVGMGQLYFSFFIVIVMMIAFLMNLLKSKNYKLFMNQGVILYVTCFFALAGLMPKIIYGYVYGQNKAAGIRVPMEAELYGLKIIELLLPVSYTRIPMLAKMNAEYASSGVSVTENIMSPLGIVASIGFFILAGWMLHSFVTHKQNKYSQIFDFFSLSILTMVLFCTVGGFGTIFNFLVTPQIRAYNRASILIMCLSLAGVALLLNETGTGMLYRMLCVIVLTVGICDQVLIYPLDWQASTAALQDDYQKFFKEVEACLEDHAMVYQLPYTHFPESGPVNQMLDYTHLIGYLFTDTIRWSYGGVVGRNERAGELYIDDGKSIDFINGIRSAGFSGIYIDTYAYEDSGKEILDFYASFGFEKVVSGDRRFYFYKLQDRTKLT